MKNHSVSFRSLGLYLLLFAFSLFHFSPVAFAEKEQPIPSRAISRIVEQFTQKHYSQQKLDDKISKRVLQTYLNRLDPGHYYFLESDIQEFKKYETQIDDMLAEGDVMLALDIFRRFKTRLTEKLELLEEFLKEDFDFSKDDSWEIDREHVPYPKDQKESAATWRRKIKFDLLTLKLGGSSIEEAKERILKRLRSAWKEYSQYPENDVVSLFLNALTASYDPHSSYLSARDLSDFNINIRLSLEGIGAVLRWEDGYTVVSSIVPGGAAFRQGELEPNDRIIGVAQENKPFESVNDMRLKDVVQLIRGKRGTKVRLQVLRKAGEGYDTLTITITRDKIILQDREAKSVILTPKGPLNDQVSKKKSSKTTSPKKPATASATENKEDTKKDSTQSSSKETVSTTETKEDKVDKASSKKKEDDNDEPLISDKYRIGIIQLPSFYIDFNQRHRNPLNYKSSSRDVKKHIISFAREGVDGIILDLRDNGGGGLDEAIAMSGLFVGKQPIVMIEQASGHRRIRRSHENMIYRGPLLVILNRSSASASEIFAGAMQDFGRAILVGDRTTFGKGTVQNVDTLSPEYGALKVTVAQFYRVAGGSTQNKGVEPDIGFPSIRNEWEFGESTLEYALPWKAIEAVEYDKRGDLSPYLPQLMENSKKRIKADEDYQKLEKNIEEYVTKIKPRKFVTILKLQEDFNKKEKEKEEEKKKEKELTKEEKEKKKEEAKKRREEELKDKSLKVYHRDIYLRESVSILEDYIEMLKSK